MKRNDEIITPDGFTALVLTCAGDNVCVWLLFANKLPREKRIRNYRMDELK